MDDITYLSTLEYLELHPELKGVFKRQLLTDLESGKDAVFCALVLLDSTISLEEEECSCALYKLAEHAQFDVFFTRLKKELLSREDNAFIIDIGLDYLWDCNEHYDNIILLYNLLDLDSFAPESLQGYISRGTQLGHENLVGVICEKLLERDIPLQSIAGLELMSDSPHATTGNIMALTAFKVALDRYCAKKLIQGNLSDSLNEYLDYLSGLLNLEDEPGLKQFWSVHSQDITDILHTRTIVENAPSPN